jgi:hypothetical protein
MPLLMRRRLLIAVPLVLLALVPVAILLFVSGNDLRSRSTRIAIGMPRQQVEDILGGRPEVVLHRSGGKGEALVWVDQLWQVEVLTGPDGRTEAVDHRPSDSLYRRTVGRLTSYP